MTVQRVKESHPIGSRQCLGFKPERSQGAKTDALIVDPCETESEPVNVRSAMSHLCRVDYVTPLWRRRQCGSQRPLSLKCCDRGKPAVFQSASKAGRADLWYSSSVP
jgi:hypothetical protein